ncbi:unnamed protein product [Mytilus edulis]|uniref:G-protein coupled receptors family 1 profile domain-containing protein n=1 Tax=Mytilus edulis TaxID=6550 RepID=A0A8S3QP40_MYTED|nr:unnamed protein product [Mytilus edulis]
MAVVTGKEEHGYKLGIKDGILRGLYTRNQFELSDSNFIAIQCVNYDNEISFRKAVSKVSLCDGQGYTKCGCSASVDKDRYLVDVYRVGIVISYIAMLMNIVVFAILCRKNLHSPATILMQGLAASDFLTAFSSYGLQPLFHSQYNCTFRTDLSLFLCDLHYPYSSMVSHASILFFTFHNVSYLITTCLGIQKVIAIIFPIWTRNQLTKTKTVITCVLCFMLPIALSLPRHVTIWLEDFFNIRLISQDDYFLYRKYEGIIVYSAAYYLGVQTVLMTCCCVVMLMSTVFIVFKLVTNRFQGRMTEQRKQERKSIIMVVVVLAIFLLTEIPRVLFYVWWCYIYTKEMMTMSAYSGYGMYWSMVLIKSFKDEMDILLISIMPTVGFLYRRIVIECIDVFTVIGCSSNFIIYFVMSTKMRNEIKKVFSHCQHLIGRKTTDRTSNGYNKGINYAGHISKIPSGLPCLKWSEVNTHPYHNYREDHNYCRNPLPSEVNMPYCYTTKYFGFEKCVIPVCGKVLQYGIM